MEIRHSAPRSLGVEKLIYIGDDDVDTSSHTTAKVMIAVMGVGLFLSVFGKTKATKTLGAVVALAPVALEVYYHVNGSCTYDLP